MKRILISGASGFVGTNIQTYLKREFPGCGLLKLVRGSAVNADEYGWSSLAKAFAAGPDVVLHLAGKAHDLKRVSQPEVYYDVNTTLTQRLFDEFLVSGAGIFIMLSSVKAVRDIAEQTITETMVPAPGTHYGKSKLHAEEYVMGRPLPSGKRVYILRPCMIHGPGNKGNLNLLFQIVKKGIPYPLASFENERSFLSVQNLCFIIRELIERNDILPGIYNAADDTPLSTNRVIEIMSEELGQKKRLWKVHRSVVKAIARIGDYLPFPLNSERLQKLTENYIVSNKKLKTALGKPLPLTSEQGLRITLQSFVHVD